MMNEFIIRRLRLTVKPNKKFDADNLFVTVLAEQQPRQPVVAGQSCGYNLMVSVIRRTKSLYHQINR